MPTRVLLILRNSKHRHQDEGRISHKLLELLVYEALSCATRLLVYEALSCELREDISYIAWAQYHAGCLLQLLVHGALSYRY